MKYALAAAALLAITPAAHAACLLCNLGAVVNGIDNPPQTYYQPYYQPAPQFEGPQFHSYTFPNGGHLHCTTIGTGMNAQTFCN